MTNEKAEKATPEEKKLEAKKADADGKVKKVKAKPPKMKPDCSQNPVLIRGIGRNPNLLCIPESIQQLNPGIKKKKKVLVTITKAVGDKNDSIQVVKLPK